LIIIKYERRIFSLFKQGIFPHNKLLCFFEGSVKIYTLVALAVFGSICFTSGFFLGQHTYYDDKSLDLLKQGYMDYLDNASESQKLGSDLMLIDLLRKCENEDCSGVIDEVLKPQLREVVERINRTPILN
jgi:hypothetical protein